VPPPSPLPLRHGLAPAWVKSPDRHTADPSSYASMTAWLRGAVDDRVDVERLLGEERFVYADATPVRESDAYRPHTFVWFHRDLRDEPVVPGEVVVVHRDERVVVVDKPAFLSTVPRGNHVVQSLVVRMRDELGLPDLTPMHRLDRITSGLVLCVVDRRWRGAYQSMFAAGTVRKTYRALAPYVGALEESTTVRDHVRPIPRTGLAEVVPGAPVNAETVLQVEERVASDDGRDLAVYRLHPRTGRTHQLRLHLLGLGAPIVDDPLYPVDRHVSIDDFSAPLQLLASELAYVDPVDGGERRFVSDRRVPLVAETHGPS
jgi:tRNA pseudouridine32 synthase/23S rRNA pseudouridine746 synthase